MEQGIQNYWPISHELAMINGTAMKGKRIIIPFMLWEQILEQLHSTHMGIEKIRCLARKSGYWVNMNVDIENTMLGIPGNTARRKGNSIRDTMQALGGCWC